MSLLALLSLIGCSSEPEPDGQCAISCSGASWGGSSDEFRWVPMFPPSGSSISCSPDAAIQTEKNEADVNVRPYEFQFRLEKVITKSYLPAAGGEEEEAAGARLTDNILGRVIPVSGVAFRPQVLGSVSAAMTNIENAAVTYANNAYTVDPVRYAGITTPQSEWCTDSCGVATIEVWPKCPAGANSLVVALTSGSVTSEAVTITLVGPTTAASELDEGEESGADFHSIPDTRLVAPDADGSMPWLEHAPFEKEEDEQDAATNENHQTSDPSE